MEASTTLHLLALVRPEMILPDLLNRLDSFRAFIRDNCLMHIASVWSEWVTLPMCIFTWQAFVVEQSPVTNVKQCYNDLVVLLLVGFHMVNK